MNGVFGNASHVYLNNGIIDGDTLSMSTLTGGDNLNYLDCVVGFETYVDAVIDIPLGVNGNFRPVSLNVFNPSILFVFFKGNYI